MPLHSCEILHFGGPGSSHQNAKTCESSKKETAEPGQEKIDGMRNPAHSAISGGGGERDNHHTHNPETKG